MDSNQPLPPRVTITSRDLEDELTSNCSQRNLRTSPRGLRSLSSPVSLRSALKQSSTKRRVTAKVNRISNSTNGRKLASNKSYNQNGEFSGSQASLLEHRYTTPNNEQSSTAQKVQFTDQQQEISFIEEEPTEALGKRILHKRIAVARASHQDAITKKESRLFSHRSANAALEQAKSDRVK